jgi:hypothetical protein
MRRLRRRIGFSGEPGAPGSIARYGRIEICFDSLEMHDVRQHFYGNPASRVPAGFSEGQRLKIG